MSRKPDIWEIDWQANQRVVDLARAAGVEFFVFISVLDGDLHRGSIPQVEARERVVDGLRSSPGLPFSIVAPTGFFNDMAEVFNMARGGTSWLVGDGTNLINPIHAADLAEAVSAIVEDRAGAENKRFNVGGPQTFSMREISELAHKVAGTPPCVRSCPTWLVKGVSYLTRPFNANVSSLLAMFASISDGRGEEVGSHTLQAHFEDLKAKADATPAKE
mmetsp:Transcript_26000/g.61326  ORF Transcript_26000/g.61326 Transcript_26000/m.61326 type:complete len:218 (-) Transcript_26000:91-744(-)